MGLIGRAEAVVKWRIRMRIRHFTTVMELDPNTV